MPSIDFELECNDCGKPLRVAAIDSKRSLKIYVGACESCIATAVSKEEKEGQKLLEEAVEEAKADINEHWNAILNTEKSDA